MLGNSHLSLGHLGISQLCGMLEGHHAVALRWPHLVNDCAHSCSHSSVSCRFEPLLRAREILGAQSDLVVVSALVKLGGR